MKRRKFIKNVSTASAAPLVLNGAVLSPHLTEVMSPLLNCDLTQDRSVVVLFLKGGNDGLNTILPVNQYDTYVGHRADIALGDTGPDGYIPLDTTVPLDDQIGIHPRMGSFKSMYDEGRARIIQGVGYPNHDQSHFKSTDLWLGGNDGVDTGILARPGGWIGRFFEHAFPGTTGNPTVALPDPLGIQLGDSKPTLALHDCSSQYQAVNLSWQNPSELFGLLSGLGTQAHDSAIGTDFGDKMSYIMEVENDASVYGERITNVYDAGINSAVTYPDSNLGNDFATVARLLSGGSKTKVFQLHRDGFDTHGDQVLAGSTGIGSHADLLGEVCDSIKAFHDDLSSQGLGNKVVTIVFSEFSRRITQNGSFGTDHGNFGPMFLFGDGVNAGVSGSNLDLTAIDDNGYMFDTELQFDYRSVFKTVLQDWMGAGTDILDPAMIDNFPIMTDLIDDNLKMTSDCYITPLLPCPADFNGDGVVDVDDFLSLNTVYGSVCPE